MKRVFIHKVWRFAYPDCCDAVDFVDENTADYDVFFTSKRVLTLGSISVAIGIGTFLFFWLSNELVKKATLMPWHAVAFGSLLFSLTLLCFYSDWLTHNLTYVQCKMKIMAYQAIWPTILEVIKANRGKLFLPPEPLRADYVEIVEPVFVEEKQKPSEIDSQPLIEAKSIEAPKAIIAIEAKTETEITETEAAQAIEPVTTEVTAIKDEETVAEDETTEETVAEDDFKNIPVTNYEDYCRKWHVNNKRGVI